MPSLRHQLPRRPRPPAPQGARDGRRDRSSAPASRPGTHPRPVAADAGVPRLREAVGRHGRRHRLPVPRAHAARTVGCAARSTTSTAAASWPPIDAFHVRYATRLADAIGARVVMPDYPLAPEHTWARLPRRARRRRRDAGPTRRAASCWPATPPAAASRSRWRCRCATAAHTPATHLVLHAPWVDLTTSAPRRPEPSTRRPVAVHRQAARRTPRWWAGSPDDLGRPRSPPALADLAGPAARADALRHPRPAGPRLPPARHAGRAEAGWDLTGSRSRT